jgi:hypothetical protein
VGYLNDLLKKIEAINVDHIAESIIESTEDVLIETQRAQMMAGLASDGGKIGEYKQELYAVKKHGMNPGAGFPNVDLRYKGDFQEKITAVVIGNELVIDSSDWKTGKLVDKYGERIFGLNEQFKKEYLTGALRPAFRVHIESITGLKFMQ